MSLPTHPRIILFLASGFGVGYLPGPKGTYGSLVGVGYYLFLGQTRSLVGYVSLVVLGILAAVWISGRAEEMFQRKDAQEIVLDEIACFPIAMLGSEFLLRFSISHSPVGYPAVLFWINLGIVFVLYRLFDILKPPPLRRAEYFSGGWGIILDDLWAGLYTALISTVLLLIWFWFTNPSA